MKTNSNPLNFSEAFEYVTVQKGFALTFYQWKKDVRERPEALGIKKVNPMAKRGKGGKREFRRFMLDIYIKNETESRLKKARDEAKVKLDQALKSFLAASEALPIDSHLENKAAQLLALSNI